MKIISRRALEPLTLDELHRLFADVSQRLTTSDQGTPSRRNALASLETIEAEINARHLDL
jgi:hypothetical protein